MESVRHVTLNKDSVYDSVCLREGEQAFMSVSDVSLCVGQEQKDREAELHSPTDIPVDRKISFWIKFVELQV